MLLRFLTSLFLAVQHAVLLLSLLLAPGCCEACETDLGKHLYCRVCLADNSHRMSAVLFSELVWLKTPALTIRTDLFCSTAYRMSPNVFEIQLVEKSRSTSVLDISLILIGFWWVIICAVKKCCSFLVFMCTFPMEVCQWQAQTNVTLSAILFPLPELNYTRFIKLCMHRVTLTAPVWLSASAENLCESLLLRTE